MPIVIVRVVHKPTLRSILFDAAVAGATLVALGRMVLLHFL